MSDTEVFEDTFNLLCGPRIGYGHAREVYACKIRSDVVVKVENQYMRSFHNVFENDIWNEFQSTPSLAKWLAPCVLLSPNGRVLLQKRCQPIGERELPKKVPHFLTDLKRENFGILNDKIVCVDYPIVIAPASGRLVKADWHEDAQA